MSGLGVLAIWSAIMAVEQQPVTAGDSVAMMAHWRCQVWSGMAADDDAAVTHYEHGLAAGRRFVEAARAGLIPPEDFDTTVPMTVSLTMDGPSDDFVLGRLFEMITQNAFDDIVTRDANGVPRSPPDYVTDGGLRAVIALNLIRQSNCSALQK